MREDLLATPVRSARAWTTALAPNRRGGWNFITQIYEAGSSDVPLFVVVDLDTGKTTTTPGVPGGYANSNYQVAEQLRARNGRIFFPQLGNHLAYYDPDSEDVKQLGQVVTTADDKGIYRIVFGPDGKLYGGTQSKTLPTIFEVDPDTLSHRVLGKVGDKRNGYSYAYYIAPDPPWIYVVVGQDPWELVAFDMRTSTSKVLATRAADGFIELETGPRGIAAKLVSKLRTAEQQSTRLSCVDGRLVTTGVRRHARAIARVAVDTLGNSPELDLRRVKPDSAGIGRLRWRPRGTTQWKETSFQTVQPESIPIDSLIALADGTLFGSAKQYHGFFRFDPKDNRTERFDGIRLSGGPRVLVGKRVYFAGYPKSQLYVYDPSAAWNPQGPRPNPAKLGSFEASGAHYPYFLVPSRSGRIYFAGRRERTGRGGAVGFFDPGQSRFAGSHDNLETTTPRGLVFLDAMDRLIYSARQDAAGDARLVVFDRELREQDRLLVRSGLKSTGVLYTTADKNVVIGISTEDQLAYRFDVAARRLLATRKLAGSVAASTVNTADGSIWMLMGSSLMRLDAQTLELDTKGIVAASTPGDVLVWHDERLYRTRGGDIYEVVLADNHDAETR